MQSGWPLLRVQENSFWSDGTSSTRVNATVGGLVGDLVGDWLGSLVGTNVVGGLVGVNVVGVVGELVKSGDRVGTPVGAGVGFVGALLGD